MKDYLKNEFDLGDYNLISAVDELSLWSAPFGLKLLDTIKLKRNIKALDIGFGLGFPLIELAMRLGDSSKIYGIDPWQAGIDRTNFKITQYSTKNIEIIKGNAENMPFDDNFFDLIISNNGINNVNDIPKVFKECYRVSKPGAQFVFTMNLEETMKEFYDIYRDVLHGNGLHDEMIKLQDHIYEKRKPLPEIKEHLTQAGFVINEIYTDSFNLRYADGSTMLNHFSIKLAFLPPWIYILPSDKIDIIFEQIENKLNQIAQEKGELNLSVPFVTIDCKKK